MLRPADLSRVRWSPFIPQVENFALAVDRRSGGLPNAAAAGPAGRLQHAVRYLMACGHESLPGHAVCSRGCLQAPFYGTAFRGRKIDGQYTRGLS